MTKTERARAKAFLRDLARACVTHGADFETGYDGTLFTVAGVDVYLLDSDRRDGKFLLGYGGMLNEADDPIVIDDTPPPF